LARRRRKGEPKPRLRDASLPAAPHQLPRRSAVPTPSWGRKNSFPSPLHRLSIAFPSPLFCSLHLALVSQRRDRAHPRFWQEERVSAGHVPCRSGIEAPWTYVTMAWTASFLQKKHLAVPLRFPIGGLAMASVSGVYVVSFLKVCAMRTPSLLLGGTQRIREPVHVRKLRGRPPSLRLHGPASPLPQKTPSHNLAAALLHGVCAAPVLEEVYTINTT